MRFFSLSPGMLVDQGVLRLIDTGKTIVLERFDRAKNGWVDSPQSLKYLMGEDPDAKEITEEQANAIVASIRR